jgi:hypothetical protein
MYMSVYMYIDSVYSGLKNSEEGVKSPGTKVKECCEHHMYSGKRVWVL